MGRATEEVIQQYERYVMNTYVRSPLVITKAKGSRVWDVEGRRYIIRRFWPDNEEETQVLLEDSLRNWVNFYTALMCDRLKATKKE